MSNSNIIVHCWLKKLFYAKKVAAHKFIESMATVKLHPYKIIFTTPVINVFSRCISNLLIHLPAVPGSESVIYTLNFNRFDWSI